MSPANNKETSVSICLIGSYPPPFGGVSVHIKSLKAYLEEKGYSCVVYNSGKNKKIQADNVIHVNSLRDFVAHLFRSKANLHHIHGGAGLYKRLVILYIFKVIFGKRWLVTIHSGGIVKDLHHRNLLFKKMLSIVFNSSERVICVSVRIKNTLTQMCVQNEKCVVIPAFSMDESVASASMPEDVQTFLDTHAPILACLGYSFEAHYGYDLAIQAKNRLKTKYPGTGLIIMGGDKGRNDFAELRQNFKQEELQDVLFTGDIDHGVALSTIRQSDAFLRPTYHDGDSISVREAMAMNVPVVASDTEMRPQGVVLFQTGNGKDLSEKILRTLENKSKNRQETQAVSHRRNLEAVYKIYQEVGAL